MKRSFSAGSGSTLKKAIAVVGVILAAAAGTALLTRLSANAPESDQADEDDDFVKEEIPGNR